MILKIILGLFSFLVLVQNPLLAQYGDDGFPFIRNYSPTEYDSHVQNWGFAQDDNGVLYIANTAEILQFDGVNWNAIPIKNARSFSIKSVPGDKIYVGGSNEFGFLNFAGDNSAIPDYKSLRPMIPDSLDFGIIWNIEFNDDYIFFYSAKYIFKYDGQKVIIHEPEGEFYQLYKFNNSIYIRESTSGFQRVADNTFYPSFETEFFSDKAFLGVVSLGDKNLYCASNECFFEKDKQFTPINTEVSEYLKANFVDEMLKLSNGTVLIATRKGGIINIDQNGELIHIINEETGLISNVIYGLYEDHNGAVWVATVNGISKIEYSLPFRKFDERNGITSLVKRMVSANGKLYGTALGGIFISQQDAHFKQIHIGNTCSNIMALKSSLYINCDGQLYLWDGENPHKIANKFIVNEMQVFSASEHKIIFGNEVFVAIAALNGNSVDILYQIDEIRSRPNSIVVDEHKTVWIGTDARGLFKIDFIKKNGNIVDHTVQNYLTNLTNEAHDLRVYATKLNGKPAFLTWGKGILHYNADTDSFELIKNYGEVFTDTTKQVFWASEDQDKNVWFRFDQKYQAALYQEDGSYRVYSGVLNRIEDGQSNTIYPDSNGFVWFSIDNSLIRYDKNHHFDHTLPYHTQITGVLVKNDSLINTSKNESTILDYENNELRFTYAAASYDEPEKTQYRVKLAGFDDSWSIWTNETQKDYTNIPEGDYGFVVQAKNVYGTLSVSEPIQFSVLPPWYRTWWAYLLYSFTIAGILYTAYKIRVNQLLKVERIRNSIASDLHDEVSATLSSISYFAQAVKSDTIKGDKNRFIDLIFNSSVDAKEKISDIVWAINPENDNWSTFLSKCRRFTSDLLESKNIKYSLKIDDDVPAKLDMQLRQHLWLVYKEMITNAARHSDAKNINVIIKYEQGILNVVVQDDGTGMDVDLVQKGNGLVNIQKRADLIKSTINLTTDAGFGTRWNLKIPL